MQRPYAFSEITNFQFVVLITGAQIGIGILTLPADVAEVADTSGWISVIIGWALTAVASIVIVKVMSYYPDSTIIDVFPKLFGKYIGGLFIIGWLLYALFAAGLVFYTSIFLIQIWILPHMPLYGLSILFSFPGYLVARHSVRVLGRYAEVVFFLTLWMFVFSFFLFENIYPSYLLPIIKDGWIPILQATHTVVLSFIGFEITFMLYPYLQDKTFAIKGVLIANSLTLGFYLFILFLCFIFFSPYEITSYKWPTLNLLKVIELPFIERLEILFLSFYLLTLSTTGIPYFYIAAVSLAKLFGKQEHKIPTIVLFSFMVIISFFYSPAEKQLEQLITFWGNSAIGISYIFPVVLLVVVYIIHKVRKRK
ncbi:spore germination protein (amino acid permease) [Melghiribacillus thermohalophilus]|uniref:Spore germination protein (Amino acid permease) n=1 Tax=Melghiribacillus thermohalophilus TaxID=1324956 RepID=A0A4R3MPL1_9BACI|nr:endospore germination permease [Melghiribacillus thermohalophilus]TCT17247.1 spore germination protein (amino acid permease) [Melghiribacillus thermohalophilus]